MAFRVGPVIYLRSSRTGALIFSGPAARAVIFGGLGVLNDVAIPSRDRRGFTSQPP